MNKLRLAVAISAVLLPFLFLQGCTSATGVAYGDPARMKALFSNYQADYIVMSKPSDLERISHVVVSGRIAEIREGRTWQVPDIPWSKSTSVILVVEREALLGGNERLDGSRAYVELPNPGRLAVGEYQEALPVGSRVLFYLSKASSKADNPDIASVNGNEEIDSEIYLPVSPQGFGVASQSSVVWPMAGVTTDGTLEESYPRGNRLPQD